MCSWCGCRGVLDRPKRQGFGVAGKPMIQYYVVTSAIFGSWAMVFNYHHLSYRSLPFFHPSPHPYFILLHHLCPIFSIYIPASSQPLTVMLCLQLYTAECFNDDGLLQPHSKWTGYVKVHQFTITWDQTLAPWSNVDMHHIRINARTLHPALWNHIRQVWSSFNPSSISQRWTF